MKNEHIYGYHAVLSLIKNAPQKIVKVYLLKERHDMRIKEAEKQLRTTNIETIFIEKQKLLHLVGEVNHQGIVAEVYASKMHHSGLEDFLAECDLTNALFLILDGVSDPHNLGACLRTANAAGVTAVIVPRDNAVGITPVVRKVASGAAEILPFIQVTNLSRALQTLQDHNIWIYGAAGEAPKTIYEIDYSGATALVLGAEEKGLRRLTREYCDELISIPMLGDMPSLNVSVATGICLFEVVRQRMYAKS